MGNCPNKSQAAVADDSANTKKTQGVITMCKALAQGVKASTILLSFFVFDTPSRILTSATIAQALKNLMK
jgi:hypothetical protein